MKLTKIEEQKAFLELRERSFELSQREAKLLSASVFFPQNLKGDVASAVIVSDLARRLDISVPEVSQNICIIHGKPSFSTTFLVARLNQSGLIRGVLKTIVSKDKKSAYCEAVDAESGEILQGMTITMDIAKAEGWLDKKGSKWQTMPELMLRKRAQSFFIKEFYPQVMFGMQSKEEVEDITDVEISEPSEELNVNQLLVSNNHQDLEDHIKKTFLAYGISDDKIKEFISKNSNNLQDLVDDEVLLKDLAQELANEA